jgi:hypothetical protein
MFKAISNIPRFLMLHNKIDMFYCRINKDRLKERK